MDSVVEYIIFGILILVFAFFLYAIWSYRNELRKTLAKIALKFDRGDK